ncbi:MAG: Glycosyltransferase [Candidatus Beckwithbacteria bacterium GW2011_GWB1_47_15]|uniref:Glycosyltransferase n=1 Tax=Candidatus Beckwithbacteria bacterium GW2011_GWB1_47_15 TaxID=1618371 RepID=A0A0G1UVI3_9BACT|nr:MAG: glycosyl transferase group 1 protein [Candidatus Beckwithbacteria bacterium GW2011_GWC1_49_16]KKU35656.1 MAG: Glycosyltransferase [Candidatus Beckwithbacteria bacterium GW2011_GWA1_46_30]KKU61710.1 MAG: Glycosyltransferase [Candidatus Beckwithbacteria bacterium GW2011_GWB1_47_15]KKU72214.1 MAG: Glycosyltransferase [Candidatus Beckwithbacteria bacterium GW2011_GWA2_47_25]KKW05025.1 MAG: Glycosyltransferase [Candidatus Beckwithbacteria bacterium GW2011_GWC2_49_11]
MMRLLLITYELPPLGGGTAVACQNLLQEFAKEKNLKIDVVTASPDQDKKETLAKNIIVHRLSVGKRGRNLHHQSGLNLLRFLIRSYLWAWPHRRNYDLVHAFGGLPAGLTAWALGRQYLISLRGGEEPGYETRYDFWLKLAKPFLSLVYRRAKSLDANSRYLKRLVLKSFPGLPIKVIRNGVDQSRFYPAKKLPTKPVILSTSRLGQRKGVEDLIAAMPKVLAAVPDARLVLIGGGQLEGKIRQLVKKLKLTRAVKSFGPVEHKNLPSLYRRAKIFVLPSLTESQSNSLLEAQASGLPVVVTRVGGNPETVNQDNGILVPVGDSKALAEAIVKALNRPRLNLLLQNKYSWEKTANEYLKIYNKVYQ